MLAPAMQQEPSLHPEDTYNCRICHQQSFPLLRVCQCLGSLSYVHQVCIKKWIGYLYTDRKIKTHPTCQLCGCHFSASIAHQSQTICYFLMFHNFFNFSPKDKLCFLLLIALSSAAVVMTLKILAFIVTSIFFQRDEGNILAIGCDILLLLIFKILFPLYFFEPSIRILNKIRRMINRSKVYGVRITIHPRMILYEQQ